MEIFTTIFVCVKQMAWSVTFVIPVVLLARWLLGKVSRRMCYLLWGIVAVRLLCPVLLPSDFSLFCGVELAESRIQAAVRQSEGRYFTGNLYRVFGEKSHPGNPDALMWESGEENPESAPDADETVVPQAQSANGMTERMDWWIYVWLAGMSVLFCYAVLSCLFLQRKLKFATRLRGSVYESDVVGSPFVFGVIEPKIYLPYHLSEQELDYILMHERYHIKRRDYLVKWLAYFLLAVYWFHPLVWAAYLLMNQDMELSCDEYVLRDSNLDERKEYGRILLRFSGGRTDYLAAGLGFSERSVKNRMKHILQQKKRTAWSAAAALIFLVAVMAICLTDSRNALDSSPVAEDNTQEGASGQTTVSQAAQELFNAANPYIGDASANGRLLGVIGTYSGGLDQKFTTELQTSEEPYVLTLHFEEAPDDTKMWRNALLFLALTENCGEVRWDYPSNITSTTTVVPETDNATITFYVPLEDANGNLGVDDIKEYAASAQKVEELLTMLDDSLGYHCKGNVLLESGEKDFVMQGTGGSQANEKGAAYIADGEKYIVGGSTEDTETEEE